MRRASTHRRSLAFAFAVVALLASGASGTAVGCGVNNLQAWTCINPATGREDPSIYDGSHYVNGVFDPCHCYDPCGEAKMCPILVDAGPPGPSCDAGDGGL